MTSRQTLPDLVIHVSQGSSVHYSLLTAGMMKLVSRLGEIVQPLDRSTYSSSMFGWKIRFTKPMLGLL